MCCSPLISSPLSSPHSRENVPALLRRCDIDGSNSYDCPLPTLSAACAGVTCSYRPPSPSLPPPSPLSPPPPSPPFPPFPPTGVFGSKADLAAALGEFCADQATAEATHGAIAGWDVSAVTEMEELIFRDQYDAAGSCKWNFNSDINSWNVSQVTSMKVWLPHAGAGCGGADWRGTLQPEHIAPNHPFHPPALTERVCAGAAQNMFRYARTFNQPINSWDVSKLTNMNVRLASEKPLSPPAQCSAPLP